MTTYGAYNAGLKCKNPNCKSFGKPHPNCRCFGDFAAGGEVKPYCSTSRSHQKGCEYFAEGGDVGDLVPEDDLPQVSGPEAAPALVDEVPADDLPDAAATEVPANDLPESSDDNINLSPAELQEKMVLAAHPDGPTKYETPTQQLATVAEGVAQGIGGPLATAAETKLLGVEPEDIVGRQEANPGEHGASEVLGMLAPGPGKMKAISKVADVAELARLGKVGTAAIKGFIQGALIQGSDEASKAILGQGDPHEATSPFMAMGANGLLSSVLGAGGAKVADAGARLIETQGVKLAAWAENFLAGMGHAASGGEIKNGAAQPFRWGYNYIKHIPTALGASAGAAGGAALEASTKIPYVGSAVAYAGAKYLAPLINRVTTRPTKYVIPAVTRWLSEGAQGSLFNMIEYADRVAKGTSAINNTVDSLFKAGSQQLYEKATPKNIEKLRAYIDGGGIDQTVQEGLHDQVGEEAQGFAEGGKVEHAAKKDLHSGETHLAHTMPEQNLILQTAKGRVSKYLSSQRPQKDLPKLAFDDDHDDREQQKTYTRALEIAASPLSVLHHINKGTVEPEHIAHLNAMYPELTGHLQKKVTEKIVKAQLDGKKPSFVVRQGLSMLMGTPLSGEMTPQNIQAAQAVFLPKQKPEGAEASTPKKGTASLTKSDRSFLTDDQARQERRQKV